MIVVIADDLTGAAELAGIGLHHGLQVELSTIADSSDADMLVIATDTRSMDEGEAILEIEKVTNEVMLLQPQIVYKKIDSVLRGHIIAEIKTQLKILDKPKALVVAANPSLGRTIVNGNYFYNNEPIYLSSFSNDPEFAIKSAYVLVMLRTNDENVIAKKVGDIIPESGIFIADVNNADDLMSWADKVDETILPVGGSDFFSAILTSLDNKINTDEKVIHDEPGQPILFVSGTTFDKSRQSIKEIKNNDGPVSYMPVDVIELKEFDAEIFQLWCNEIVAFIHSQGKAIIAIDAETIIDTDVSAKMLREKTAMVVDEVFKQIDIREMFIEGGSTAAAIIKELEFQSFIPVEELARGVVRMKVKEKEDLFITVKPGSYIWPREVWNFE